MKTVPAADADDVFQQTWIRACAALPGYRCQGKFQAWLFRIGRNLAVDAIRRRICRGEVEPLESGAEPPDEREPWNSMDDDELKRLLEEALRELPPEQRAVFAMRRNEVSFKVIAARQHCPVNTAVVRMRYAVGKIREFLEKRMGGKT
ncbi:ECF RNA polymerase sigma-E factor [bioreactor metagenome]|uniref:ECF RNA polymerase sigma-E factor n=1 Tax=bioreactor metagenome TaxID=1076179 RepID=A0A645HRF4_9ZZZZ